MDGWIQDQRDVVWEKFEAQVGQKVVYDRIAPNVLAALDFQNVRILADDGSPVLTAASIRLSIDWGMLLEGRIGEALKRVQVINAVLNFDDRRDRALLEHWTSFIRPGVTTAFGYEVEGFNLTVHWTDGVQSMALDRGFLVLTPREGQWGLRFRGALGWNSATTKTWARLSVRGDLRSDAGFQNWSLRTEASSVRTSWFDLEPVTLQIAVSPDEVTLAKVADQIPLDLQAVWNRKTDQWSFKGAAEGFRPSRQIHLKDPNWWIGLADGTVTGKFAYRIGGDFSFTGSGAWPAGAWPAPFNDDPVEAVGSVRTEGGNYHFEGFHLEAPLLAVDFDGTIDRDLSYPEGTLHVDRYSVPGVGTARGTLALSKTGTRISFTGTQVLWNDLGSDSIVGWVERKGSAWNFGLGGPVDGSQGGTVWAEGAVDPEVPAFDALVRLSSVPLGILEPEVHRHIATFELPSESKSLVVSAEARVRWSSVGTEVAEASFDLKDPGDPKRHLQGTGAWKSPTLEMAVQTLSWDGLNASGQITALFHDGPIDLTLSGRVMEHSLDLTGRWIPMDRTLVFSGNPGISGNVHQNQTGAWLAQLSLAPLEVAPGWTLGVDGQAALNAGAWKVDADRVVVTGRYPWNQEAFTAAARLTADQGFFRLEELTVDDLHGRLTGACVSSWSADWSQPWAGRLSLSTPGTNRETLVVNWVGTGPDRWHCGTEVGGFDLARLPQNEIQGRLGVTGTADWQGADVRWNAQTILSEARWGDSPLGFRASLSGTNKKVSVRNASLSVNSFRFSEGSADVDTESRTWTTDLRAGLRFGAGEWLSRWTASGSWNPEDQPPGAGFTVKTEENTWSRKSLPDGRLTGRWDASGWNLTMDGGLSAHGLADGSFQLKAQSPFPVQGDARGSWKKTEFAVSVHGFNADLGLVKEFINSPMFSVTRGEVSGDFSMGGAPSDPEVTGRLVIHGLTLESSFVRQPLGPVDVPVVFEGHRVQIDQVNIGPPGQTWLISGGARLDHLLPEEFQFAVQTDTLSVIPASYQYTGLSAVGNVSGLFLVRGTPLAVSLGGRLVLQDAVITLKQSASTGGPGPGFNADLTLITGRKVEFLWPNETLPLIRAVTAPNQVLVIRANDIASTWSVAGNLALKTGEINYLNQTFLLKEGELGFKEDQLGFDPRISVRAEMKVRETTGPILINLRADGTLSKFSPRFDATPYQTPEQLQQLVGSSLALPGDYTNTTSAGTALSVASDVGTSFLLGPFENTVKKNFNLDLFTVKTEILKRSLLNRNGPLQASDYLDNTRLYFGKYIGDDLFIQGTLAFSQGTLSYNQDGTVTTQETTKMVVEPELLMEFQTPLFLLDWNLFPQHPETLFVTDNTVTFRWNWSY